jgi:2-methoxy-6-polyprenyl-1,4-benzoquinol methylase
VPRAAKAGLVEQVFTSVAPRYDAMNDLMSGGLHRLWKDHMVAQLAPFAGMRHLDVAGGTGDVALRVLRAIEAAEAEEAASAGARQRQQQQQQGQQQQQHEQHEQQQRGRVTVCDINPSMLSAGRAKAAAAAGGGALRRLDFVLGDAERLPFADAAYDAYTIAFGIRNVTDRDAALREAHRVLKRGGRFLCLEFSPRVEAPLLRAAYDAYSFAVIPKLGELAAGDGAPYAYLVESIRRFPPPERFADMARRAGFKAVTYELLMGGAVALHSGFKL